MATYVYRCDDHGALEVACPIGTAPSAWPCPDCGAEAVRVFTAPRLSLGDPTRRALIEASEKSRDEPAVVSAPPPGRRATPSSGRRSPSAPRRPAPQNPALARLPRP